MRKKPLKAPFDWHEWKSDKADLERLGSTKAARILFDVFLIRAFETELLKLKNEDCVWGPVHSSVGQEAAAACVMAALKKGDKITGSHRAHHQFLSKALQYVLKETWNPASDDLPEEGAEVVKRTLAEIMGLADGYCSGRGGSMHLRYLEAGVLGTNAIVGGGIPLATGSAFAEKRKKSGNIVVCFFGDGAVNQGSFHESANLAGLWKLPIIYAIENNEYAVATRSDEASAVRDLSLRALSYAMHGAVVQGDDPAALVEVFGEASAALRRGENPWIIEIRCYRHLHHSGDLRGSAYGYRDKEEEEAWKKRDVYQQLPSALKKAGLLKEAEILRMREMADRCVMDALDYCTETASAAADRSGAPSRQRRIKPERWPKAGTAARGMRSDEEEFEGIPWSEREDFARFREMAFSDAIAAVAGRWMERDSSVITLGEEVANFGGGAFGATKGLPQKYPDQVINTPISEAGFTGLALGAAVSGMKPILEIMYPDFSMVAADQLFNQIAKARHMYGGTTDIPLVARTRIATGCGYGAQHSMSPVGLFALFPGWRMVAPSNAFDYIGLFNTAMVSLDPVLIMEHHSLYARQSSVPEGDLDYFIAFGRARVLQEGTEISIIVYSDMAERLAVLETELGSRKVSAEIIDLRTLDYPGIDWEAIGTSVKKTGAALIVEQACKSQSIGARIASEITERFFDYLDMPTRHLTSLDVPLSVSRALEKEALISDDEILDAAESMAKRRWK
jgi:2-oxoisovalerate dehydrogenase E1 component